MWKLRYSVGKPSCFFTSDGICRAIELAAWVPYLPERIGRMDLTLSEVDEAEAERVLASARRFWGRVVG